MGPKKETKGKEKEEEIVDWRSELDQMDIITQNWDCFIGYFMEASANHCDFMSEFAEQANMAKRKSIRSISSSYLKKIIEYMGDGKPDKLSSCYSLALRYYPNACKEAFLTVKKYGIEAVPIELIAKIIKYEILKLKEENILTEQKELQREKERENEMIYILSEHPCEAGGGVVDKSKSEKDSKSAKPGKDDKTGSSIKKPTRLAKIGEEWKEAVYINDAPKGGPCIYVVISEFYDPALIMELIGNGIPLKCIVRLKKDGDEIILPQENSSMESHLVTGSNNKNGSVAPSQVSGTSKKSSTVRVDKELEYKFYKQRKLNFFWNILNGFTTSTEKYKILEDTAFINYSPPDISSNQESDESVIDVSSLIFDHISFLMYDIHNLERQHILYIRNMKMIDVKEQNESIKLVDLKLYTDLMDSVPCECITIPILLDCLLEEVSFRSDVIKSISVDETHAAKSINTVPVSNNEDIKRQHCGYKHTFKKIFNQIGIRYRKKLALPKETAVEIPKIIDHEDDISLKTFHLSAPKMDLLNSTLRVLKHSILAMLWKRFKEPTTSEAILCCRELDRLFEMPGVKHFSTNLLIHSTHGLMLEYLKCQTPMGQILKLPFKSTNWRTSTAPKSFSCRSRSKLNSEGNEIKMIQHGEQIHTTCDFHNPDFDVENSFTHICPDLSFLLERPTQIASECHLDDYTAVDELTMPAMLQCLYEASSSFNCADFYYFQPTDTILLHCHNSSIDGGLVSDAWEANLTTPVCFRDFVNFVLDEEKDWLEDETRIYNQACDKEDIEEVKKKELIMNRNQFMNQIGLTEVLEQCAGYNPEKFIKPGSIKDQIKQQSPAVANVSGKDDKSGKGKGSDKKDDKGGKGKDSKKAEVIEPVIPYRFKEDSVYRKLPLCCAAEGESFVFRGYDLGSDRVQISGTTTNVHSNDCTYIKVDKSEWMWREKMLTLEISKLNNRLIIHTMAQVPPKIIGDTFCFHINVANGIIFALEATKHEHECDESKSVDTFLIEKSLNDDSKKNSGVSPEVTKVETHPVTKISVLESKNLKSDRKSTEILDLGTHTTDANDKVNKHESNSDKPNINVVPEEIEPTEMTARLEMEKKLHDYLINVDAMTPKQIEASNLLKTKSKMLNILEAAKEQYVPCYKICSTKLHSHKYLKRIKPHVSISIGGIMKKLFFTPPPEQRVSKKHSSHYFSKWSRVSSSFNQPKMPINFQFQASLPSGLVIKLMQSTEDYDPYYIKQYYIIKGPACKEIEDEICRCFLRNGTVLIFKKEGKLKILSSDSSIYLCQIDGFEPVHLKPDIAKIRSNHKFGNNKKKARKRYENDMTTMIHKKEFYKVMQNTKSHEIRANCPLNIAVSRRLYRRQLKQCSIIAKKQFKHNPNLIPIPEYNVILPDGTSCTVRNGRVCNFPKKVLVQSVNDHRIGETFTERLDGTKSFLGPDGDLVTSFPDGTRIKTYFQEDKELVHVYFSEEELALLHNSSASQHNTESSEVNQNKKTSIESSKSKSKPMESSVANSDNEMTVISPVNLRLSDETTLLYNINTDEISGETDKEDGGFVLVHLICEFEHPNYASVKYSGVTETCYILMPDNVSAEIDKEGNCVMKLDTQTDININNESIRFQTTFSDEHMSSSFIDISPFTSPKRIFEVFPTYFVNVDSCNNVTELNYEGTIKCSEGHDHRKLSADVDVRGEQSQCQYFQPADNHKSFQRYLVLKRDLSGYEYLHKFTRNKYMDSLNNDIGSVNVDERNDHVIQKYITSTKNVFETYSDMWITPYCTGPMVPKHILRKDIKPSTYYPGFWLSAYHKVPDPMIIPTKKQMLVPRAVIKRIMLDLMICQTSAIRKLDTALLGYDTETRKINYSLSTESTVVPVKRAQLAEKRESYEETSAHNFKERWYQREREVKYYKQILKSEEYPNYFSPEMELMLFDDIISQYSVGMRSRGSQTSHFSVKYANEVVEKKSPKCECPCSKFATPCPCPCGTDKKTVGVVKESQPTEEAKEIKKYIPDLKKIAEEWTKRDYNKYKYSSKKYEEKGTQVELVVENIPIKVVANEKHPTNVQPHPVIPKPTTEILSYMVYPEEIENDVTIPIKGLGVRPYVQPMCLCPSKPNSSNAGDASYISEVVEEDLDNYEQIECAHKIIQTDPNKIHNKCRNIFTCSKADLWPLSGEDDTSRSSLTDNII